MSSTTAAGGGSKTGDLAAILVSVMLFQAPRGVSEGLIQILGFQVRVRLKYAVPGLPGSQQADDRPDRDPHPADARLPAHDGGVEGDSLDP